MLLPIVELYLFVGLVFIAIFKCFIDEVFEAWKSAANQDLTNNDLDFIYAVYLTFAVLFWLPISIEMIFDV